MKHFIFNEEHEELRRTVRRFVEKEVAPFAQEWDERGDFPNAMFERMGELGFLGLHLPEEYGGQGGDLVSYIVMIEELVRSGSGGFPMGIAVQAGFIIPVLEKFGTAEQKRDYLVPSIAGKRIACLGITEPEAGSDVSNVKTTARQDGDEYVINGSKTFITNGVRADYVLLVAKTNPDKGYKGFSLFLVDKNCKGFEVGKKIDKVGMRCSDTVELFFDDCRVPASALLGKRDEGFTQIMWELNGERLVGAAGTIAGARYMIDLTLDYIKQRKVFGKTIASYQVWQHRLAEAATKVEAAQNLNYTTLWRFLGGDYPIKEIAMCKVLCGRTCFEVADECIQAFGGYGYTSEYAIGRMWRDSRLHRIGGGSDEIMFEVIAKQMGM
jgi:alkylation response protein AidB-like acyl-CoA dehydrogenase